MLYSSSYGLSWCVSSGPGNVQLLLIGCYGNIRAWRVMALCRPFADLLSHYFISCCERYVGVSNYNCGFENITYRFYHCLFTFCLLLCGAYTGRMSCLPGLTLRRCVTLLKLSCSEVSNLAFFSLPCG